MYITCQEERKENEIKPLKKFFNPKIIERPGPKLIDVLKSRIKKPSKPKNCETGNKNCLICNTEGGGDCRSNEIVYEIRCVKCGDKYIGETHKNT